MDEDSSDSGWHSQFKIHPMVDLDFVLGQELGWPVGMKRSSPAEFRRRVLAAAISYQLRLRSIDYARKRYVPADLYENQELSLGDMASDFLSDAITVLGEELKKLHTQENLTFGRFGAEITLFRFPEILDIGRMLANRGLFLEVLPILRLALEMISWAVVAFYLEREDDVRRLRANACLAKVKPIYESAGQVYGYLSRFSHWEQAVHPYFLDYSGEGIAVISASREHRAMSLTLCLLLLEIFVEAVRHIYGESSTELVIAVQGTRERNKSRKTHQVIMKIIETSKSIDLHELKAFVRSS